MSDYQKFIAWLEKTYPTHARAYSSDPVIQSAFFAGMAGADGANKRMFEAACVDLGRINECLGLDPDDGGAAPIIEAIAKLKDRAEQGKSFGEKYPRNPDAKCSCEHWQACIDCHPTYIEAAMRGEGMNDEIREAFEKWVLGRGWSIDRTDEGIYRGAVIDVAWDAWRKAESDTTKRLRGEARVMQQLLHLALGVISDCYPDDSSEAEMMQDLENQIKAVLRAAIS